MSRSTPRPRARLGSSAVELAVLLPLLAFLFLLAADYGRIFYFSQTLSDCARNGALYACDPYGPGKSTYTSLDEAARADAPDSFRDQLTVESRTETVSGVKEIVVSVGYPFTTLTQFPGIPHQVQLTRTVRMPIAPATPN
jgi:hypothetical protein